MDDVNVQDRYEYLIKRSDAIVEWCREVFSEPDLDNDKVFYAVKVTSTIIGAHRMITDETLSKELLDAFEYLLAGYESEMMGIENVP